MYVYTSRCMMPIHEPLCSEKWQYFSSCLLWRNVSNCYSSLMIGYSPRVNSRGCKFLFWVAVQLFSWPWKNSLSTFMHFIYSLARTVSFGSQKLLIFFAQCPELLKLLLALMPLNSLVKQITMLILHVSEWIT